MHRIYQKLCSICVAGAFLGLLAISGCAARVYDPYYHDYHYWNHDEVVYYQQWEHDTHRDHKDFKSRSQDEQNEYWKWRHSHQNDH